MRSEKPRQAPSTRSLVILAIGLSTVHVVVAVLLVPSHLLSVAYQYEGISSIQDLSRLRGSGAVLVTVGTWLPVLLSGLVLITMLLSKRTRRIRWIVPLVGLVLTVALSLLSISALRAPTPLYGG